VLDPSQVLMGTEEGENSDIPKKYIIVQNDCLVRVKRVLVYREKHTPKDMRWMGRVLVVLIAILLLGMILIKKNSVSIGRFLVWPSN
jgi:hypothetical protein